MTSVREPSWRADDTVVVRTPLLPASTLLHWASSPDVRRFLVGLLEQPAIEEAIFIASPSLHASIPAWREKPESPAGQRTERALAKYVARMSVRSTPFGLFSGISIATVGRDTKLELAPRAEYRRRTRLDNDYLFVLADELARTPAARERLVFRPNTSVYRIAGRLRYAAARVDGKNRHYDLASTEPTPYLEATLARAAGGATLSTLAAALVDDTITSEEATEYITQLVSAQLLVPDLGIHITGPEPLDGMLAQLRAGGLDGEADVLEQARRALVQLDAAGVGNSPQRYRAIATTLEVLPTKIELARLFQVDMVKPAAMTVSSRIAADVLAALGQLARIARHEVESLSEFRSAFAARWENREIPLAEALDEESGIGFESGRSPGTEAAPLLRGLAFPGLPSLARLPWPPQHTHMLRRLAAAVAAGEDEIVLADADFTAMKRDRPAQLPGSLFAMVKVAGTHDELARGDATIYCSGASGPSGANLLGRFCHASPELERAVRAHLAAEEAQAPHALFAEVVHLNEGRIGNVLCRPVLRDHEIVFLGISGAPRERQILVEDLMVSVRDDRIVLRSRRLDREIVPRLTTAHNFRLRSLCVYRFLCALAAQDGEPTSWSWGPLADAPFLPRVRVGRVILELATWNLFAADLEPITKAVREAAKTRAPGKVAAAVQALRDLRRLPRFLTIVAGDNELPIDLDNPLLAAAFADELAGSRRAQLHEMFPPPDRLPVSGDDGRFANELLMMFTRTDPPTIRPPAPVPSPTARRTFVPGSEWLYAKIYCGEAIADRVLREAVAPVVCGVHSGPWFFLRYQDPDPHVRVRFRGAPADLLETVLPELHRALEPLLQAGAVRKVVLDTYERELERYGGDAAMELVEQIFWRDSECVLGIVELLEGDEGANARWQLAVRGIDSLLDALGLNEAARERVVSDGRDMLGREVGANATTWGLVGDRFTKERALLDILFARDPARDAGHDLEPGFELLAKRDEQVRALGGIPGVEGFAWSLAHMHANRLLHAAQRTQELVLYDFLRRLHASRRARSKA